MNDQEFMDILYELIILDLNDGCSAIEAVETADEAGLKSLQKGLFVTTKDGSKFQLCMMQVA